MNSRADLSMCMHPLTSPQREIWFEQAIHPQLPLYNIGGYIRIEGPVDAQRFEHAIHLLLRKHDCLRTVLSSGAGKDDPPLQSFADDLRPPVPLHDFSGEA